MTPAELTGCARTHIAEVEEPACALHVHARAPFLELRRAAAAQGFDLAPQSSYRDFERQLGIWNRKWTGALPLFGAAGEPLDAAGLDDAGRVEAILRWSALPGASRHHWGTDVDLIDRRAIAAGHGVQLVAAEYVPPGPFAQLADWLESHAARFGFFRPYRGVLSGVQAEPWHFSFAPIAEPARRRLDVGVLRAAIEGADLCGRELVLARLEELHARFVRAIDWP